MHSEIKAFWPWDISQSACDCEVCRAGGLWKPGAEERAWFSVVDRYGPERHDRRFQIGIGLLIELDDRHVKIGFLFIRSKPLDLGVDLLLCDQQPHRTVRSMLPRFHDMPCS